MVIERILNVVRRIRVSNVYFIVKKDWVVAIYADKNVLKFAINNYVEKISKLHLNVDIISRVLVELKRRINKKNVCFSANLNKANDIINNKY